MQPHVIPLTMCVNAIGLHAVLRAATASLLVAAAGGAWEWFAARARDQVGIVAAVPAEPPAQLTGVE